MHPYYRRREPFIKLVYRFMTKRACRLHTEKAASIRANCRQLTPGILDRLPYIGGRKNVYTSIMIINGWFVMIYKAMESENFSQNEILKTIYHVTEKLINMVPVFIGRVIKRIFFSNRIRKFLEKQSSRSQEEQYECDFKFQMSYPFREQKDKHEINFCFEKCGVQQYYRRESCPGLSSFCNFADPIYGKRFGLGLDADHTMAQGYDICTLSFNNKRATKTPANVLQIIDDPGN